MSAPENQTSSELLPPAGPNEVVPQKVHLRGLDNLHTKDIRAFALEHYPDTPPVRIEWIDDTSANLIYETAETAALALSSFSVADAEVVSRISGLQPRRAKRISTHPDAVLEARLAVMQDRKLPGARERSRFYLFNPDVDPGERRHRERGHRRRGRRDSEGDYGNYRRRPYDRQEHKRRKDVDEGGGFDANMYDDDAGSSTRGMSPARSDQGGRRRRQARFGSGPNGRELFPERAMRGKSALRDRSASPGRGPRSSDLTGSDDAGSRRTSRRYRARSRSPRIREREGHRGSQRERRPSPMDRSPAPRPPPRDISAELRGLSSSTGEPTKELFAHKTNGRHHRRSGAFDAADETADLFAGRMTVPFTDGAGDRRRGSSFAGRRAAAAGPRLGAEAMDSGLGSGDEGHGHGHVRTASRARLHRKRQHGRSSSPPAIITSLSSSAGMIDEGPSHAQSQDGRSQEFHIRGAGKHQDGQGFSIRGTTSSSSSGGVGGVAGLTAKESGSRELFPQKLAQMNPGRELFSEKLQGRARRRRKAEDMFY